LSTQVAVGDFTVTSNSPAAGVVESLTSDKPDAPKPEILVDEGKAVTPEDKDKAKLSEAASELGKKGAAAAAAKRAEAAKEKVTEKPEPEPEKVETKAEDAEKEAEKSRSKQRVEEATRAAAEAKRQAAQERQARIALEQRLAALEARSAPPQGQQPQARTEAPQRPQAAPDDDPQPKQEDFEDYGEYVEKRARWAARDEHRTAQRQSQAHSAARAYVDTIGGVVNKFHERLTTAGNGDRATFMEGISPVVAGLRPSFLLDEGEQATTHTAIADEIVDSEKGPQIMRYFTDNPDEFQRIATLRTPRDIAREMAKLEAKLDSATSGNPPSSRPPVSKPAFSPAPPPVQPVTGMPNIAEGQGYREGMSLDDYARGWKPSTKR
jgi:chemotaxis protein histidine kinase CheA